MNNNQFRHLVLEKPGDQNESASAARAGATPSSLGTRKSSLMPMTPRTVKGGIDVDFARQVRERNAALRPAKKFKSATPKGVKYGAGYTDRAKGRAEAEDGAGGDDKAGRITALEEQMKLGQISVEMFEALRDQITGGSIESTHLVKGLDRKLLERVRRGEDVLGSTGGADNEEAPSDVDDELDKLGEQEVEAIRREKAEKRGTMAPPSVAGMKRSRNDIMAELKTQRQAAAEAKAAPALDSRWRKVGEKERSRIEIDHKGREVLITVDEDGMVKKKVRKVTGQGREQDRAAAEMPDASKPVLGADAVVPESQTLIVDEDENDDIFEGVGTEYNPLGNEDEDDDDSDQDSEDGETKDQAVNDDDDSDQESEDGEIVDELVDSKPSPSPTAAAQKDLEPPDDVDERQAIKPRNYFKDTLSNVEEPRQDRLAGVQDLLKKAAKMDPQQGVDANEDGGEDREAHDARLKKRAQMLAQQDRDMDDMDLGFSGSRYDDGEDDGEGKKMKISEWKGSAAGSDDGWEEADKNAGKKKRKPKKRKGDVNNAADIMRVIEGRRAGGGKSG